jgi:hypothetical protein
MKQHPMFPHSKVLAITKRPADLCAIQALLYGAGFELVTATNMNVARSLIKPLHIKGVIVCKHSWTKWVRRSRMAPEFSDDVYECANPYFRAKSLHRMASSNARTRIISVRNCS